jgi:hypothetical protein
LKLEILCKNSFNFMQFYKINKASILIQSVIIK